jgi:flagellar capping protein FliD
VWKCPSRRLEQLPTISTTSSANGAALQVTGLASGLDTAKIVSQMMEIQKRPVTALQTQQQKLNARNTQLTTIEQTLKKVNDDALALLDPRVYRGTQKATTSDATRVAASTTAGAGVGGYQVAVTQLANAAARRSPFAALPPTGLQRSTGTTPARSPPERRSTTSPTPSTTTSRPPSTPPPPTAARSCCRTATPATQGPASSRSPARAAP